MIFGFKRILVAVALGMMALGMEAFDLPAKRINGVDYYYYTVERNDTFSDVAKKFGITRDDILRSNPSAADGIHVGKVLYFPVHEFAEDNATLPGQSSGQTGVKAPTRYKVQKGETLYGIARRFEVTPDEIVAMNPHANSGVKAGQILLIPHDGSVDVNVAAHASNPPTVPSVIPPAPQADAEAEPQEDPVQDLFQETERRLKPVNPTIVVISDGNETDSPSDEVAEPSTIALMLPLMLNEKSENRQARLSADFIRGFMLGARSMSDEGVKCNIDVYDTRSDASRIEQLLADSALINADIIIAHEEGPAGGLLPAFAEKNGNYLFNLFASHDTLYMSNPRVLQANIPAEMMYHKAAEAVMGIYEGYKPVFLVSKGGRGEKFPFTSYLHNKYREAGIESIELAYEGMLTSADLDNYDFNGKFVFIPASGSLSEFNKFSGALINLRNWADNPSSIALFGYPDWTIFRNEALETLHRLGATIYSRFLCDETALDYRDFTDEFVNAYGVQPLEQVPSQALLGYDTARYMLNNIKNNEGAYSPIESSPFKGIQSTFLFTEADEETDNNEESHAGYVNTSLYIITYLPGVNVSVQVL